MEASEYNFIASQIEEKEPKEELIATLSSIHDTPNAQAFIPAARENFTEALPSKAGRFSHQNGFQCSS